MESLKPARVVVDPNAVSRVNADWVVARFAESTRVPSVGERVLAVQPDDSESEPDFVGFAVVTHVDLEHELIYLDVDWASFRDDLPQLSLNTTNFVLRASARGFAVSGARSNGRSGSARLVRPPVAA